MAFFQLSVLKSDFTSEAFSGQKWLVSKILRVVYSHLPVSVRCAGSGFNRLVMYSRIMIEINTFVIHGKYSALSTSTFDHATKDVSH